MFQVYRFNNNWWFLTPNEVLIRKSTTSIVTCNEINKMHHFTNLFFSIKFCEIFQGLIKKFRAFPGVSRSSKIFQGFPGFPGPVRALWEGGFTHTSLSFRMAALLTPNRRKNIKYYLCSELWTIQRSTGFDGLTRVVYQQVYVLSAFVTC